MVCCGLQLGFFLYRCAVMCFNTKAENDVYKHWQALEHFVSVFLCKNTLYSVVKHQNRGKKKKRL